MKGSRRKQLALQAAKCAATGHKPVLWINESGKGWVKTCECGRKTAKARGKGKPKP